MTYQIITLSSSTQPDGSFYVNGVFWLTAPSNSIVPRPNIRSQVPNITSADFSSLQNGSVVEQTFNTGLYGAGTSLSDVQADLQLRYTAAQNDLNNRAPIATGLVGIAFDGTSWTTPTSPLVLPSQSVSVNNIPMTSDGRWTVAPNAFPGWVTLYFAGQGDDINNGIGQGSLFQLSSNAAGDGYITWQFNDLVFILGATLIYTGAVIGDTVDYLIYAPATITGAGSTQVNLSNVGPGNIIVPAAGSGMTTIDITKAIPVPNQTNTGFWNWSNPITGWGTITPSANQTGSFDLFDFTIPLGHPALQIPIIGSSKAFDLLVESVTAMQVLPQWVHKATLHNSGHEGLSLGWVLATSRATSV